MGEKKRSVKGSDRGKGGVRAWFGVLESLKSRGFCNKQKGKSERKSEDGRKYRLGKLVSENGEGFQGRRESCSIKKDVEAMVYAWKKRSEGSENKSL